MKTWLAYVRRALQPKWFGAEGLQRVLLLAAILGGPAHASTITVDNGSSGSVVGACTLQDAVAAANTNAAVNGCTAGTAGPDTIVFASGITSISLAAAMTSANLACTFGLAVTEDLSIDGGAVVGSGVPKVTIQRSIAAGTPNFGIIGASLYNCGTNPTVKLNLTLAGLTIGNANNAGNGGGVAADILTVRDGVITGNHATNGGGIYAFSSLTMTSSTVSNNSASFSGGGIAGDVPMTISGSTINGNSPTGILGEPVTIDNSTISGNTGPGIDTGSITAYFVTITANTGPGIYLEVATVNNSVAEFDDTVIVGNGSPSAPTVHDLDTTASRPITGTFNHIGSLSAVALSDLSAGVRIASCASLNLGLLANNGGGTQTHALLAGSCLIDAGGTTSPSPTQLFANDQRGNGYPRFVNTHADIGAFEYQGAASVDGACGSDNGQTLLAAPINLCSAGSASAVAGSGHPWSWTCTGAGGGGNASCTATIKTWTVSAAVAGSGGSVSPAAQSVDNGATASVTATAASGYSLAGASGCGSGALSGNVYTTAAITANCAISVAFTAAPVANVVLSSNANPALAGQSITFTAIVSGNSATPTGTVTFSDGASTLGSVATASGVASLTTASLSIGTHAIRASYAGDGVYPSAVSNTLNQSINAAPAASPVVAAPVLSEWALWLLAVCTVISALVAMIYKRNSVM
jgi:hypothetical protein